MEISWRWLSFYYGLLICSLCNARPMNLEGIAADQQTQFLTGLIGVVLIVCSLIFLAGCLCCQKRNTFKEFRNSSVVASVPSELDHGHVNPIANGEFTIFTPLSPPTINNNVFLPREQIVSSKLENYVQDGIDLSDWFDESERDFPRIKLKYIKELGQGKFGKVVEGSAQGIFEDDQEWIPVVVRILNSTSSHEEKLLFLKDALIYRCVPHPNILSLYGKCLETLPFLLLQEYCQDDLKYHLRSDLVENKNIFSTKCILWSTQLISALKHLHNFNVIHPDLACRNCLLTADLNLKLGDYNLTTSKYPADYYRGNSLVPIRWCDPESVKFSDGIRLKKLTTANNIWSLGVTLWEICQCGEQPYANLTDEEVILQVLQSNLRLQRPSNSASYMDNLYFIIQACWNSIESRPNINQVDSVLSDILEVHIIQTSDTSSFSSDDFDKKWEMLKPNSFARTDHIADSISIEMTDNDIRIMNPLSPSKGSLNNLLLEKCEPHVEFKFEEHRQQGISENPDILEEVSCHSESSDQGSIKVEPNYAFNENSNNEVRNFVYQKTSSGSESEDENWRNKVERGAYTEKVRMKSRSVADLMILTHVDYSESESETPLPSLDFRVNYKNVRSNLENSHTFGSEGNLLSIHDTFQEELKKLQEERKDSLLFVPDMSSKSSPSKNPELEKDSVIRDVNTLANSSKLIRELSSPERIQPSNQVYNIFNVSVENHAPIYQNSKLHGIINLNSPFKFETEVTEAKIQEPNKSRQDINVARPYELFTCDNVKSFSDKSVIVECDQQSNITSLDNVVKTEQTNQGQINLKLDFTSNNESAPVECDTGQLENKTNTDDSSTVDKSLNKQCQNNDTGNESILIDCIDCDQMSVNNLPLDVETAPVNMKRNKVKEDSIPTNYPPVIIAESSIQNKTIELGSLPEDFRLTNGSVVKNKISKDSNLTDFTEITPAETKEKAWNKDKCHSDTANCINQQLLDDSVVEVSSKIINNVQEPDVSNSEKEISCQLEPIIENDALKTNSAPEQLLDVELNRVPNKRDADLESEFLNLVERSPDVILSHQESKDLFNIETTENLNNTIPNNLENSLSNDLADENNIDMTLNSPDLILSCNESVEFKINNQNDQLSTENQKDSAPVSKLLNLPALDGKTSNEDIVVDNGKINETLEIQQIKEHKELYGLNNANHKNNKNEDQLNNLVSPEEHSSYEFLSCEGNLDNDLCNTSESLYSVLDHNEFDPVRSDKDSVHETCDELKEEHSITSEERNETCLELDNEELCHPESHDQIKQEQQPINCEHITTISNCNLDEIGDMREDLKNRENDFEPDPKQEIKFDLSEDQDEAMPNSLTHSFTFSSTPMKMKAIPMSIENVYSSINPFNIASENEQNTDLSPELVPVQANKHENLSYSLETWDSFLNKTLNNQTHENMFDSFSSEPKSLLFVENEEIKSNEVQENLNESNQQTIQSNETFSKEPESSTKLSVEEKVDLNSTYTKETAEVQGLEDSHDSSWESGEGWFVHPQTSGEVSGEMQISTSTSDSYVGFGIDDEIMSAIRNELLSKLPHAQGSNVDKLRDDNLLDSQETNEVFLRYNVYNTPLSPIPEESFAEEGSESNTPKQVPEDEDSDWSEHYEGPPDTESHSTRTLEGISRGPFHRHTPSQDSCCSNDTLFNLEELNFAAADVDKYSDTSSKETDEVCEQENLNTTYIVDSDDKHNEDLNTLPHTENDNDIKLVESSLIKGNSLDCQQSSKDFLLSEVQHSSNYMNNVEKVCIYEEPISEQDNFVYNKSQIVPLPSPENNPWKQLPVSLSYNVMSQSNNLPECAIETAGPEYVNNEANDHVYENNVIEYASKDLNSEPEYANCDRNDSPDLDKDYNNYVNLINLENAKISLESTDSDKDYVNIENFNNEEVNDPNIFGILTDIRFNGPTDNQLMSTSFSESNNDEQEWDSGSDSRSSSSGEFIWKVEEVKPMEIINEDQFEESDVSSSFSDDDDDGETPEFIPSAWDKFAMPSKSALRSPEKTLNKSGDKKAKVWFKKQKYHCIYEYPKEPESPVLQSQDLWKPQTDFRLYTDWEFDGEPYCALTDDSDIPLDLDYKSNNVSKNRSLYQLTDVSDFMPGNTGLDEEFFISSSSQPFNAGSSSQFFPGSSKWGIENIISGSIENATPDSGVEDITPVSQTDNNEYTKIERSVPTLKQLATACVNKNKQANIKNEDVLGGLRHTRNRLKLDLPPSPSAFTNEKVFVVENSPEPVIREKPTFTTFGKSRFLVQHIDTPEDETQSKNVSFEALPYKPLTNNTKKESQVIQKNNDLNLSSSVMKKDLNDDESDVVKLKIEIVRGEASLLDSADEDSGIESSTLERKLSNV